VDLQVPAVTLAALLLAVARATGFVLVAPPFNTRMVPGPAKAAIALALAVVAYTRVSANLPDPTAGFLVVGTVTEVVIGLALGFVVQLFFTAVQYAGDLLDVAGGFTVAPAYDPMLMAQNTTIGRMYNLLATVLLFTSGGHLLVVRGFVTSYAALPVAGQVPTEQLGQVVTTAFSQMFLAALQIAGPMVAVLLLADVALALLSRAAPALNVFSLGPPAKIMLTLVLLGLTFPLLPPALDNLLDHAMHAVTSLKSG
jgi:flagellar biosynthetic protein FliR